MRAKGAGSVVAARERVVCRGASPPVAGGLAPRERPVAALTTPHAVVTVDVNEANGMCRLLVPNRSA